MSDLPVSNNPVSYIGHYAGFASRLMAFILDSMVISGIVVSLTWFIRSTMTMLQVENLIQRLSNYFPYLLQIYDTLTSPWMNGVYTFFVIVSYYIFFWTVAGQTIGKGVMGIKIVPQRGGKMSVTRSILRYIGYFISGLPFGLGFLWILVDIRRYAWHDKISKTCVVYVWEANPDETFLATAIEEVNARQKALRNFLKRNKGDQNQNESQELIIPSGNNPD
jgi:uncharacterized RDD family membrane protein YckC